jgi:hypothetical protein
VPDHDPFFKVYIIYILRHSYGQARGVLELCSALPEAKLKYLLALKRTKKCPAEALAFPDRLRVLSEAQTLCSTHSRLPGEVRTSKGFPSSCPVSW